MIKSNKKSGWYYFCVCPKCAGACYRSTHDECLCGEKYEYSEFISDEEADCEKDFKKYKHWKKLNFIAKKYQLLVEGE